MMTAAEFIYAGLQQLHRNLDTAMENITSEQLHAVPGGHPKANTIAWSVWHVTRTEDNVVRWVLQDRRPTVWAEGGYAETLGLPPVAQGTGMSTEDAHALRIRDAGLFRDYMARVWAATDELCTRLDPKILDKTVTVKPLGEMEAIRALGQIGLAHGMMHYGEIELARTLVGAGAVSRF